MLLGLSNEWMIITIIFCLNNVLLLHFFFFLHLLSPDYWVDLSLSCSIMVFSPVLVFCEIICAQQGYVTICLQVPEGSYWHQEVPDSANPISSGQELSFFFSTFVKVLCRVRCDIISMQVCWGHCILLILTGFELQFCYLLMYFLNYIKLS